MREPWYPKGVGRGSRRALAGCTFVAMSCFFQTALFSEGAVAQQEAEGTEGQPPVTEGADPQQQEAERLAAEQEAQRLAAEQEAQRLAAEQEAQRVAAEREAERVAAEREAARMAAEQEAERLAAEQEAEKAAKQKDAGFQFGSFGRIRAATDLRGSGPQWANIVAYGSRLDASPYVELELRNTQYPSESDPNLRVRVVSTVAMSGDPYHYTGKWESNMALRNLFVDIKGLGYEGLSVWMGARMARGDDIYLLDTWPLDNLNTVGGGVAVDVGTGTRALIHIGTNRLMNSSFQYQSRLVPSGIGTDLAVTLDRPRTIGSAKITQFFNGFDASEGVRASLYAEGHFLPSGTLENSDSTVRPTTELPSDTGFVIGAQGTVYGFGDSDGSAHLFVRYARGIAAYGDLAVPKVLTHKGRASASDLFIGAGSNYQTGRFALMSGAYIRYFDASMGATYSANQFWEGILALRPHALLTEHVALAAEFSGQFKSTKILDGQGNHNVPTVWRVSLLPILTPMGMGTLFRPIIYGTYTASIRNDAARSLYPTEDPRSGREVEHYLGLQTEWWFNQTGYP